MSLRWSVDQAVLSFRASKASVGIPTPMSLRSRQAVAISSD
ncbi:MAG: hypothetical protein ACI4M5_03595 [Christensenellales bacterium]